MQAWAARHDVSARGDDPPDPPDATVDILTWNGAINVALLSGDPRLNRRVAIRVSGLDRAVYRASLARVDERHSSIAARCPADVTWPDETLWARLRATDKLHDEPLGDVSPQAGMAHFGLDLPMPGVARIRLVPRQG